jgi:hypothetical protein
MNLRSSRWKVADEDRLDAEYSTDTWRDTSLGLMRPIREVPAREHQGDPVTGIGTIRHR